MSGAIPMGYFILRICAVAGFIDAVGDTGTPGFDHDRYSVAMAHITGGYYRLAGVRWIDPVATGVYCLTPELAHIPDEASEKAK